MKTFNQFINETAVNSTGPAVAGINPPPDDFPPVKKKKKRKPDDKFMGNPVFKVSQEEYDKCITGKMKYERYAKYLKQENTDGVKDQIRRSGAKSIIVQNEKTGEMSYLFRR